MNYYESMLSPDRPKNWVVYHVKGTGEKANYKRKGDAVRLANKLGPDYAVAERLEYTFEVVHWVRVKNLMSQTMVWEKSNTPYYLSVSSNTYWET